MKIEIEIESPEDLNKCADVLLEAERIRSDKKLMQQVKPVLEERAKATKKYLDLDDLRKLVGKKAEEEYAEQKRKEEDYFSKKVLGSDDAKKTSPDDDKKIGSME